MFEWQWALGSDNFVGKYSLLSSLIGYKPEESKEVVSTIAIRPQQSQFVRYIEAATSCQPLSLSLSKTS